MIESRIYYDPVSQRNQVLFLDSPSDNLEFVETKEELRSKNPALVPKDLLFLVKADNLFFQWSPQAEGLDDGQTILQASDWNGVGRWTRVGSISGGDPGPQGPQGLKGDKGDTGRPFTIDAIDHSNNVADYNDQEKDFVLLTNDNGTLWIKNSNASGDWKTPIAFRGPQGLKGDTGSQGEQGPIGLQGEQGPKGDKGDTGSQGAKGDSFQVNVVAPLNTISTWNSEAKGFAFLASDTGDLYIMGDSTWNTPVPFKGPKGEQGIQGIQGATGTPGSTFLHGFGVPNTNTGKDTDFYLDTATSEGKLYRKNGASWNFVMNLVGPVGPEGSGGGSNIEYNCISRYAAVTSSNLAVWITSSSTFQTGVTWSRTGTSLTLVQTSHGLTSGERVIVRNTNVDNQVGVVVSATANDFTIECANTGNASGTAGAYGLGFNYTHQGNAGSITGGTLTAPINGNVVLLGLQIHVGANMRAATTYNLVVPPSATNGAGNDTGPEDIYLPSYMVRQDADSLTAVGATVVKNVSGSYNTFQFGGLPAVGAGIYIKLQF